MTTIFYRSLFFGVKEVHVFTFIDKWKVDKNWPNVDCPVDNRQQIKHVSGNEM